MIILGRVVEWIDTTKKIPIIIARLKNVFTKLIDSNKDGAHAIEVKATTAISDGFSTVASVTKTILLHIYQ